MAKLNLMSIAVESETINLEPYFVKANRLLASMESQELAQFRLRKQIALEGFFDLFKSKEKEVKKKEASESELLKLIIQEYKEVIEKLKKEPSDSITLKTSYFGNAKTASEFIQISKEYITFTDNIKHYYELFMANFKDALKLAEYYLKNQEDNSFKDKYVKQIEKAKNESSPFKLFKTLKNVNNENKYKNLKFIDKKESINLYSSFKSQIKITNEQDNEDIAQGLFYDFFDLTYFELIKGEEKSIIFSSNELISLFNNLLKVVETSIIINKTYNGEDGEIGKLINPSFFNNTGYGELDPGELFGLSESFYQGNFTFLSEDILKFIPLFDSTLRIKI